MKAKLIREGKLIRLPLLTADEFEVIRTAVWRYWHSFAVSPEMVLTPEEKLDAFRVNHLLNLGNRYSKKDLEQLIKTYEGKLKERVKGEAK